MTRSRRWRSIAIQRRDRVAALVLVLALIAAATVALLTRGGSHPVAARPPTPPSPVASASAPVETPTPPAAKAKPAGSSFRCATHTSHGGGPEPVALCIPALHVDTSVMSLGLNPDRTVQVPPLSKVGEAGWYRYSAAPGAIGPTVILGHIDSAQFGDGVFFRLGTLRAGDQVELWRGDGKLATFRVDTVTEVSKRHFPTDDVYGATSGPAIRLVTCGGQFDSATGNYLDNIIVYGTLLGLRTA